MKVLHINCNYIGTALHQTMIEHSNALGVDNHVFVPTYKNNIITKQQKNLTISKCFNKWDRLCFDYKQGKIFNSIKNKYIGSSFDVIHAHTLFTDGNCAMRLARMIGIPYIIAIRNTDVNVFLKKMPLMRRRGLRIMADAAAIVFLSKAYQDIVYTKYIPEHLHSRFLSKSYIIPNGIDDFWHINSVEADVYPHDIRIKNKCLNIIYAGRINREKNILATQVALKIIEGYGYDVHFTVVGEICNTHIYNKIMRDKHTHYIKPLPKEKLINIYRDNDIFVMPSISETFGLVYAEAMSQGLPVIYSKGQGFDRQFPDGEVGFAVISKDPLSIANGILKVVENYPNIQPNCALKSRKFDWNEICKEYYRIYMQLTPKCSERISPIGNGIELKKDW